MTLWPVTQSDICRLLLVGARITCRSATQGRWFVKVVAAPDTLLKVPQACHSEQFEH